MRTTLSASQRKAGEPIRNIRVTQIYDFILESFSNGALALTVSSTPPSTMADLAHFDLASYVGEDLLFENTFFTSRSTFINGTATHGVETDVYRRAATPLDSNYVAGRYLWSIMINGAPETGSTPIVAISAPYHIR